MKVFFFKQKTAYEMRISDWSSDVCSSDLLSGEGESGARGAAPGDLYIFLHMARHKLFEREGTTLFTRAPISFTIAALGGEIVIPGLDGAKHDIRIPAGIQSGTQLRQRGAGLPVLNARGPGDPVIPPAPQTPTKPTPSHS